MSNEILEWLSTTDANEGLTYDARNKLFTALKSEDAYQVFADAILSPPDNVDKELLAARSYRALKVLTQDMESVGTQLLMNDTRAGLLAKQVFSAMDKEGVLIHKRALLDALLEAYPSPVVMAACAGGKDGLEAHLSPLMLPETSSQTLPTLTCLLLYGCTGKSGGSSAESRPTTPMQEKSHLTNGHRRKFVHSLCDWQLLQRLTQCIAKDEDCSSPIGLGEEACETLLTIVECIGYPDAQAQEGVGEEMLLSPLGQTEWWDTLVGIIANDSNETARVAAARAMVGLFGLATGHSSRIRRAPDAPATVDATQDAKMGPDVTVSTAADNKLRDWGLTTKIHMSLVSHLPQIVQALFIDKDQDSEQDDVSATVYMKRGGDRESVPVAAVAHPGRCYIVPFSSWRLLIVNLLAELVSYDGDKMDDTESPRCAAMSALMELPLPPRKDNDETPPDESAVNPWPALCDWVFHYPENNLYHVQFLRMFQAICLENHESTLRLVLQKLKFVSRAVRTCKNGGPLRGVLLSCLNCLRLKSSSLPPRAYMRHFLESHDAWKEFQSDLQLLTMEQQQPFGGRPAPGQETMVTESGGIDLGSRYASRLGFEGVVEYKEETSSATAPTAESSTTSKKKKKKRKKKKKSGMTQDDDGEGDDDEAEGGE